MMDRDSFLQKYMGHLNEKQLAAVQTVNGPVLLLAVPGSGKTTVLVTRLGYMLYCEGIRPENILTLTYTVAATNDMARRFREIFGEEYSNALEFRTINGICARVIARYGQMIGKSAFELLTDEKVILRMLTEILVQNLSEYPTESDVKNARTLITYCKNMLLSEEEIRELGKEEGIPLWEIYSAYNRYLKQNSFMDYDDQMIYAYRMLKGSPELLKFYQEKYRYICVDEAQDTSKIQHIIIGLLAGEQGNLFMVGDEDQSIYGFRAAYPEALLNFTKEHPGAKELVMDQNYRSNARIVAVADHFIQHNKLRHRKHMVPTKAEEDEIHYISLKNRSAQYTYLRKVAQNHEVETAVLYRDNESVLPLIDQLERQQIPYRIKSTDMAFFTHRVVTDVTNIMRFALNPYDTELFLRIYFKCQTYLKKNQAQQLCRISEERHIPVLEAAEYAEGLNGMVLGKCRAFATHLRNMLKEAPSRVLFRIETPLGYGEYLERNNMDDNKLFILKMLSYEEVSIGSFLGRLEYLQNMLREKRPDYDSNFILSTIHSSKGLEYEEVYLMDVCDGVFPDKVVYSKKATPQEKKEFEEERRLFYVGMTRAKSVLHIFRLSEETSSFIREMTPVKAERVEGVKNLNSMEPDRVKSVSVKQDSLKFPDRMKLQNEKRVEGKTFAALQPDQGKMKLKPKSLETDPGGHGTEIQLVIGERVEQMKYGMGVISDAVYHADGITGKFTVIFDSGLEKNFLYPVAFQMGMRIVTEEETGKEGQA